MSDPGRLEGRVCVIAGAGGAMGAAMAFNAAKSAVTQIGHDLGIHLARRNVRVNTVAIGPIDSPELREMFELIGPEQVERRMSRIPPGRPASLHELVERRRNDEGPGR